MKDGQTAQARSSRAGTHPASESAEASDAQSAAQSATATERVVLAVMQGIRSGTLVPGQHLLEPELSQRFGLSRGSLREAMKHLAAAGIVTLSRYRGAYISSLNLKSVLDLLDTLEPLARLAARLAATHCRTQADRDEMQAALDKLQQARQRQNRTEYLEMRRNFYDAMLKLGGNEELARVMPLARTDLFRAQLETMQSSDQRERHVAGYSCIAAAIVAADPDAAEAATAEHFDQTRRTISQLPDSAFA